ncbi:MULTISPECIES: hypothetical protein [unclassified Prochlorococcus]|uniref:hypothetical protein n=1 Tax=unclassified Prochlorococcus TaxID=2627481 RepID=UPI000533AF86|nr:MULTISPECIES: hypothetical protein [unclassified Prochlorococcus]KGG27597.1 hypothetical protein EV13_1999 [Prochlorococcus sp. MIT 0702]KGG28159.1 hypothetical protein EV12_0908 [Prochlorococcus sp. MIT 0701]KGG30565.1 hypothetical protein EV14_3101 [Prochlorococcus sp. MIT 0703]
MARHGKNRRKRAQREKKWIEARLAEDQDNGELSEPSEGQVFVINKITGEKRLGSILAQAKKLLGSLEDAMD